MAEELEAAVADAVVEYLHRFVDVAPVDIEVELRRVGSVIHLLALPAALYGTDVHVAPIGGRLPALTPSVLDVVLLGDGQVESLLQLVGSSGAENLRRLSDVGLRADGATTRPRAH